MKNLILIFAFITFGCKAQQIILPIEDYEIYETELQDNTYIKDVNNLLDVYEGTWVGTKNGNQYEFTVNKVTIISTVRPIIRDKLYMRYKITGGSFNTVIANTNSLSDDSSKVIKGSRLDIENNNYALHYRGLDFKCGQNGTVFLHPNGETQMYFSYTRRGEQADENCETSAEQVLPDYILLTKQ